MACTIQRVNIELICMDRSSFGGLIMKELVVSATQRVKNKSRSQFCPPSQNLLSDLCQTLTGYVQCHSYQLKTKSLSRTIFLRSTTARHTHTHARTHADTHARTHARTHTPTHTYTHTHTPTHTHLKQILVILAIILNNI